MRVSIPWVAFVGATFGSHQCARAFVPMVRHVPFPTGSVGSYRHSMIHASTAVETTTLDMDTLGATLRTLPLTNAQGQTVSLGDNMAQESASPRIEAAGGVGPLFVSIGDAEKLSKFLELNPDIPINQMFVDDYSFQAYATAGLGSMKDINSASIQGVTLQAPQLGGVSGWWKYLTNVAAISPIEKGKAGDLGGVMQLGGTFVVKGDKVVYAWRERLPGDNPNLDEVMSFVEN